MTHSNTPSPDEKLIVLSTFNNSQDAHLLRVQLEQQGIKADVVNESTTALFGATVAGPSSAFWVEVVVLASDAEKALEVKQRSLSSEREEGVVVPAWECECGETVDAGFAVCWSCNADYVEPGSAE